MTRPLLSDADRADVFRGMAHPLRRQILLLLLGGERSVSELLAAFKIPMPTLSQHLAVLRETALVAHRVQGRQRLYRLRLSSLRHIQRWLQQFDRPL
ncbi:MAG: metalloregulator ArsR/SmtB family transcription factor [Phycisphaeraceae bacterium]